MVWVFKFKVQIFPQIKINYSTLNIPKLANIIVNGILTFFKNDTQKLSRIFGITRTNCNPRQALKEQLITSRRLTVPDDCFKKLTHLLYIGQLQELLSHSTLNEKLRFPYFTTFLNTLQVFSNLEEVLDYFEKNQALLFT